MGSSDSQYDAIGEAYQKVKSLPLAADVEQPVVLGAFGDVMGLNVLDLASGTGFYSRHLHRLGAAGVTGVDLSPAMTEAARAAGPPDSSLRYVTADASAPDSLPGAGTFDLVTAVWLLNYARDPETLAAMARGIVRSLVPGGRFTALTWHPEARFVPPSATAYGFAFTDTGPAAVGRSIKVTALTDPVVSFDCYAPARDLIDGALHRAGLRDLTWQSVQPPRATLERYPAGHWDAYTANPFMALLTAHAPAR